MKLSQPTNIVGQDAVEHLWQIMKSDGTRRYKLLLENGVCAIDYELDTEERNVFLHFSRQQFVSTFNSFNSYIVMESFKSLWTTFVKTDSVFRKKYWKLFSKYEDEEKATHLFEDFDDLNGFRSFFRSFISVDKGYNFPVIRFIFSNGDEFHISRVDPDKGMFAFCCLNFSILLKNSECNGSPMSKHALLEKEKHHVSGAVILVKLDDFPYGRKKWKRGKVFIHNQHREETFTFFKKNSFILTDEQDPAVDGRIYSYFILEEKEDEICQVFPWFRHCILK